MGGAFLCKIGWVCVDGTGWLLDKNPLKAGMNIDSNKVKTDLKAKIAEFSTVEMGF